MAGGKRAMDLKDTIEYYYQLTYSVNLLSWAHVLLNWLEETIDKSLKDKFKTKEPEFRQFPGVLKRTWKSRSVSWVSILSLYLYLNVQLDPK